MGESKPYELRDSVERKQPAWKMSVSLYLVLLAYEWRFGKFAGDTYLTSLIVFSGVMIAGSFLYLKYFRFARLAANELRDLENIVAHHSSKFISVVVEPSNNNRLLRLINRMDGSQIRLARADDGRRFSVSCAYLPDGEFAARLYLVDVTGGYLTDQRFAVIPIEYFERVARSA